MDSNSTMYELKNDRISLQISDHGAEIKSLKRLLDGREYMWQADPKYWGRTSPVLFPLVGSYFNRESRFDGKVYSMGQHGFARDMDFELVDGADDRIEFLLRSNEKTHEKYPFDFDLFCGYRISGSEVTVSWKVVNTGDRDMFFSIGAHPAFCCDLDSDLLLFEKNGKKPESITSNIIEQDGSGCLSDRQKTLTLSDGVLKMSDELFCEDALVIEDEQADSVSVLDKDGNAFIRVDFSSKLFGVWSPVNKHAPFVCIEPWYGRCDRVGFGGELGEREYGNTLTPSDAFEAEYKISII